MTSALDGIRIIDMTHNQAGPACTQILAWLGAEVIKLEAPGKGDVARTNMADEHGESLFFLVLNANKQSLALDLKTDDGKALFKKLMGRSDVLVENFSPGALDRLGLGYDVLKDGQSRASCTRPSRASARTDRTAASRASSRSRRPWAGRCA